jgi:hypothetical protein
MSSLASASQTPAMLVSALRDGGEAEFPQHASGFWTASDCAHAAKRLNEWRAVSALLRKREEAAQTLACEPNHVLKRPGDKLVDPNFANRSVFEIEDLHERQRKTVAPFCIQKPCEDFGLPALGYQDCQPVERGHHITPPPGARRPARSTAPISVAVATFSTRIASQVATSPIENAGADDRLAVQLL